LREGVAVISAPPRAAVLAPTGDGTGPGVGVVAERVGAARLSGFSIRGGTAAPLDVGIRLSGAEVVIEDVAVSGARLAGIVIEPGGAPAVIASRIHDNSGAGVLVRSGASARIAHDLIENNGQKPGALAPGIELERGARADIESNVIVGNGAAGVRGVGGAQRKAVLERNVFQAGVRANPVAVAPAERGAAR
jgi:hypothetical protein